MDIADRIDRLFDDEDPAADPTDSLPLLADLVADVEPRLLLVAGEDGTPRFVHAVDGRRYTIYELRTLAECALGRIPDGTAIPDQPGNLWPVCRDDRSPDRLLIWCAKSSDEFQGKEPETLAVAGALALRTLALHTDRDRLDTRVRQLQNEHGVLRIAHDRTVTELLESREQQAEKERVSVRELEAEVSRRSLDLREALTQAELANETKGAFLATMSHEIRTPLTAILGFADLLRDPSIDADDVTEYTDVIRANGESLLTMLNDILEFSKIEARSLGVAGSRFSIFELVDEMAASFRPLAEAKGLRILIWAETEDATMSSDRGRVVQILGNLLQNALKFTDHGEIQITVSGDRIGADHYVRLEVRDTGIGMPANVVEHLFEAFTQADQSATRRFGGTGLGLPISRNLARLLGGDITVTSQPGCGSAFRVSLLRRLPGVQDDASSEENDCQSVWEDDEVVEVLREFVEQIPARIDRLREAGSECLWDRAAEEAARLGEEADVLQVEALRRATSGLILATESRDAQSLDRAATQLLNLLPKIAAAD